MERELVMRRLQASVLTARAVAMASVFLPQNGRLYRKLGKHLLRADRDLDHGAGAFTRRGTVSRESPQLAVWTRGSEKVVLLARVIPGGRLGTGSVNVTASRVTC